MPLISNKTPDLCYAICSEINTVSNTNIILLQNVRGSYKFRFSLKTYCNLSYKLMYGLLCLLSYWGSMRVNENKIKHSNYFNVVRNNIQT